MQPLHVVMDTWSGYNVIRRDALAPDWQQYVIRNVNLPTVGDANGNPLQIQRAVKLRIRFVDSLYRVPLLVAERLSCRVILGTQFLNQHLESIWCTRELVQFTRGDLPILREGTK